MTPDLDAATRARKAALKRSDRLMAILAQQLRPASLAEAMEEMRLDAEWRDLGHDMRGIAVDARRAHHASEVPERAAQRSGVCAGGVGPGMGECGTGRNGGGDDPMTLDVLHANGVPRTPHTHMASTQVGVRVE